MNAVLKIERALMEWLKRDYQRRVLQVAALAAYEEFARRRPDWAAALFDEHFVRSRALPLLEQAIAGNGQVAPGALAVAWARQFSSPSALHRERQMAATAAAGEYLELVAEAIGFGYHAQHWLDQPTAGAVG